MVNKGMPSSVTRLSPGLLPHTYNSSEGSPDALIPGIILNTLNNALSENPGITFAVIELKCVLPLESSRFREGTLLFEVITISFRDIARSIDKVSEYFLTRFLYSGFLSVFFVTVAACSVIIKT